MGNECEAFLFRICLCLVNLLDTGRKLNVRKGSEDVFFLNHETSESLSFLLFSVGMERGDVF